jgi:hypothetical protein
MKGMARVLIPILLFAWGSAFVCGPCLADEKPKDRELVLPLEAAFKAGEAATGDIVDLEMSFSLPKGARLVEPLEIRGLSPLHVQQVRRTRKGLAAKVLIDTLEDWSTESAGLAFVDAKGNPGILESPPLSIKVSSGLPPDPAAVPPRPIKGLERITPLHKRLAPWLAALLVAGLAVFLLKRFFGAKATPMVFGGEKPYETALKELSRIASKLRQGGMEPKAFYFELSLALRACMEGVRGFPAVRMTSQEIAAFVSDPADRRIAELLFAADAVKFARGAASAAAMSRHLDMAVEYVKGLLPKDPEPGPEKEQEKTGEEATHG